MERLGRLLSMALNGPLLLLLPRVITVLLLLSPCGTVTRDVEVLQGLERVKRHRHLQELVAMVPIEKDIGAYGKGYRGLRWVEGVGAGGARVHNRNRCSLTIDKHALGKQSFAWRLDSGPVSGECLSAASSVVRGVSLLLLRA